MNQTMFELTMETSTKFKVCLTTAAVAVAGTISWVIFKNKLKKLPNAEEILDYLTIETVKTEEKCNQVVEELRRRCEKYNALGFDCEWVTGNGGNRHPVAYLQLSSYDGYCGLFNLNVMKAVPLSLKNLLEDEKVYKVGVAPMDDSQNLRCDYYVSTKSTLDLRHIAEQCGHEPRGLASLTKTVLGFIMDKSWKVRCSDWEAEELSARQETYAATDAHVAIRIYARLLEQLRRKNLSSWLGGVNTDNLCKTYADKHYKTRRVKPPKSKTKEKKVIKEVSRGYPIATRKTPLYNNCFLQAPDGDLLCTCDRRKALWYVEKGLAELVEESPLTVRLRFEPAGRSVGDTGRYYQQLKENKCVVCGNTNSYIRKNVVPREYRKHFPEIMKEHSSHDVVLLCSNCHQLSNVRDQAVRDQLAELCDAPYSHPSSKKYTEDGTSKKIRSAARALKSHSQFLPEARRKELEDILLQYYPQHDEITIELLTEAAEVHVIYENSEYESHGMKVVEYYLQREGLLKLEEVWRKHFLDCMEPKHLPALWSIKHNEERLRVKWQENRLSISDLKAIGLKTW